jgi:DNA-binding protein HU-beta
MTKARLVTLIAEKTKMTKSDTETFLNAMLASITEILQNGEEIRLVGFGTFGTRQRKATTARNPQTGTPIEVKASIVPTFRAGKPLKDALNTSK